MRGKRGRTLTTRKDSNVMNEKALYFSVEGIAPWNKRSGKHKSAVKYSILQLGENNNNEIRKEDTTNAETAS